MNSFGGDWTERKIEILVEYAGAYLTIMNKYATKYNWRLMYFDGFAGSGLIVKGEDDDRREIVGAARRIVALDSPRAFDSYYFVELKESNAKLLAEQTQAVYEDKTIHIAVDNCNVKLLALADYLSKNKEWKVLAYIDPYGMQLEWASIEALAAHSVDLWVLIPTGLGANRLLTKDINKISDSWMRRLEMFLGLDAEFIKAHFYKTTTNYTLFGAEETTSKEEQAIEKCADLYASRLGEVFKFVSKKYVLKNSQGSTMFHYLMVSNNSAAFKISNAIITKYNRL